MIACLDTLDPGKDGGAFCPARQAWLRALLDRGAPTCLFMHHPPMSLGLPMQDQDQMVRGGDFLDLLESYDNVRQIMIGHVHRPITGHVRGIPFATMRSVLYQAPPPLPAWDWNSFAPVTEAPAMGIVQWDVDSLTIQYQDICAASHGVITADR